MRKLVAPLLLPMLVALSPATQAAQMSEAERSALQAAMVQHIDRQTIDGFYLNVDLADGQVMKYSPAKSHPMMLRLGDNYVLCTDFKGADGKSATVDFYVARKGKSYSVFKTEIANRAPLEKLMQTGKVTPVE